MTVRWGIIGPGRIAATLVPEFRLVPDAELVAVCSRSQPRADAFAAEHTISRAYGDLGAFLADPELDAVYVATPHSAHAGECVAAAGAGKHLLVEKSLACTPDEVRAVIAAARAHDVFCMEAMWTRFVPLLAELHRHVAAGVVGELRAVQGDLHAFRAYDPADRLFAPALGGGALLDLGVYVVAFAQDFLGTPTSVQAAGHLLPNGVDGTVAIQLGYPGGRTASLSCSLESYGPGRMVLLGTSGWIEVEPRFHHPHAFVVHRADADPERVALPPTGVGYTHQIAAACRAITAGERESALMPLDDSLAVADVLDACRRQLNA